MLRQEPEGYMEANEAKKAIVISRSKKGLVQATERNLEWL